MKKEKDYLEMLRFQILFVITLIDRHCLAHDVSHEFNKNSLLFELLMCVAHVQCYIHCTILMELS